MGWFLYKTYFNVVVALLLFCAPSLVYANVMHLVSGTVHYEGGLSPEAVTFQAYITSRPYDILTQDSSGCGYNDGYYWIQCGNYKEEWNAGDTLHIDMSDFFGFSAHGEVVLTYAAVDPLNLIIEIITYDITIGTDPEGLEYVVDDTVYSVTHTFTWLENSEHTISVISPQYEGTDIRYDFISWSHGQPQTHTIVADMDQSIIANFTTKYHLIANSNPPSAGSIQLAPDGGYYTPGTVVTVEAKPDTANGYIFIGWSGDKSGDTKSHSQR